MAKPIFLVRISNQTTPEQLAELNAVVQNKLPDYHTIVVATEEQRMEFQAFYDKNLINKDFEVFKSEIIEAMNKTYTP